jgi:hypothetical protein
MPYLFILIFLFFQKELNACDVCGGAMSLNYNSLMPNINSHYFGLRYRNVNFTSYHNNTNSKAFDFIQSIEGVGTYKLSNKFNVNASIPILLINREEADKTPTNLMALGDVQLMVNAIVLNNEDEIRKLKHQLRFAFGVKLPTGPYQLVDNFSTLYAAMQPGTGSFDFLSGFNYTIRYQKFGAMADLNSRWNTSNPNGYQFGNRHASGLKLFYWQTLKNWNVIPNIGILFEKLERDQHPTDLIQQTGGHMFFNNFGVDLFYKKTALNILFGLPLLQNLNQNQTQTGLRFQTQLLIFI